MIWKMKKKLKKRRTHLKFLGKVSLHLPMTSPLRIHSPLLSISPRFHPLSSLSLLMISLSLKEGLHLLQESLKLETLSNNIFFKLKSLKTLILTHGFQVQRQPYRFENFPAPYMPPSPQSLLLNGEFDKSIELFRIQT